MIITRHDSPVGQLTLVSNGSQLTGLYVDGQRYFPDLTMAEKGADLPLFNDVTRWLDDYFAGKKPSVQYLPLLLQGTAFRLKVWELLRTIPYGETMTYGELTRRLNETEGMKTCARAVGNAVGRNPISIIIPCHRVVGTDGSLTGYAGGLDIKCKLLALEQI
ncbi:MAG: methylated-DNA--[Victivallales bacterium]|nr:methylated-DNA--[protein]-cysteine S-methyltransferase [Victivallales bacterium]